MRPFFLGYRYQVSGFGEISGTCPAGADAGVEHGTLGGGAGGPFFDSVYLVHREFELSSWYYVLFLFNRLCTYGNFTWRFPEMGVPLNHPFINGISIRSHPFWGTTIQGNPHIYNAKPERSRKWKYSALSLTTLWPLSYSFGKQHHGPCLWQQYQLAGVAERPWAADRSSIDGRLLKSLTMNRRLIYLFQSFGSFWHI